MRELQSSLSCIQGKAVGEEYGEATHRIGLVRKYNKGRYNRRGIEWFAYVLLGNIW